MQKVLKSHGAFKLFLMFVISYLVLLVITNISFAQKSVPKQELSSSTVSTKDYPSEVNSQEIIDNQDSSINDQDKSETSQDMHVDTRTKVKISVNTNDSSQENHSNSAETNISEDFTNNSTHQIEVNGEKFQLDDRGRLSESLKDEDSRVRIRVNEKSDNEYSSSISITVEGETN